MDDILATYTDRFGNPVVLTRRQWRDHILRYHVEMEQLLHALPRILSKPRRVTRDVNYLTRRCFYRDGIVAGKIMKVVVEYPADDPARPLFSPVVGTILTAFPVEHINPKEQRLWP